MAASEELVPRLDAVLSTAPGMAVAFAARLASERGLEELEPALEAAFERLERKPVKIDPGCQGKTAIAEALHQLSADAGALLLRAARTVQMEPVYGGQADVAGPLRAAALRALLRSRNPQACSVAAEHLADDEVDVALGAAFALGEAGDPDALPLLRLRALLARSEADAELCAECLTSALALDPEASRDLALRVAAQSSTALRDSLRIAVGARRPAGGLDLLVGLLARFPREATASLDAIAALRSDEAADFLLARAETAPGPDARAALAALLASDPPEALVARAQRLVETREDVKLRI